MPVARLAAGGLAVVASIAACGTTDGPLVVAGCGDGVVEAGEACDDGNLAFGDGCRPDCTAEACGDGVLDVGEQCDDGGRAAGDGCDAACRLECESSACPPAAPGEVTLCGRIHDVEDLSQVTGADVEVRVYEPLSFVTGPTTAVPLAVVQPDEEGVYRAEGLSAAALNGLAAVAVDDADGAADERVLTGATVLVHPGCAHELDAWTTRRATVSAWSQGLDGADFAERGVMLFTFVDPTAPGPWPAPLHGAPAAGVTVTANGAPPSAALDYYFDDESPAERRRVDVAGARSATGANGSALHLDHPLANYSGTGGEPAGCRWPTLLAAAIPGVVWVQEKVAECE